ncbi:hypothetical protein GW17_00059437 [Ensete ventricosum]|nr:hypothetical protein GW17_00059437 [Ensete ventricosum]
MIHFGTIGLSHGGSAALLSVDLFLLHISPSLFHGNIGPTAVSLPSTSPAHGSVVAASIVVGVDFCTAFSLHMVGKFISFVSIGGRSLDSLTVEVLLLSIAASLPSRQSSSSSPPLLAELPRLLALAANCCCTLPAAIAATTRLLLLFGADPSLHRHYTFNEGTATLWS